MSPRLITGAAAWLLGIAIATTGSLVAVNELADGLLRQPAQQVLGPPTGARYAMDPTASPTPAPTPTPTPIPTESAVTRPSAPPVASAAPQTPAGTLLTSAGGSVEASCQPGGAYLIYWSAAPGFEAGSVVRGPAAVARVQFEHLNTELTMTVSCSSGTPVARVSSG